MRAGGDIPSLVWNIKHHILILLNLWRCIKLNKINILLLQMKPIQFVNKWYELNFHSAHPTGWAESISGNGVCMYVWMYVCKSSLQR